MGYSQVQSMNGYEVRPQRFNEYAYYGRNERRNQPAKSTAIRSRAVERTTD